MAEVGPTHTLPVSSAERRKEQQERNLFSLLFSALNKYPSHFQRVFLLSPFFLVMKLVKQKTPTR